MARTTRKSRLPAEVLSKMNIQGPDDATGTTHKSPSISKPVSQWLTIDRILVRWERDFDIVIPTLMSSERPEPTVTWKWEIKT